MILLSTVIGGLSSSPQQPTLVIIVVRAFVKMTPKGFLLSIKSLHPYSCLWAGFTLIKMILLGFWFSDWARIHPPYIYIYRQREEEEVLIGLLIIHFPKRKTFYSHTNSWSIIHDTLNSLIKKKKKKNLYISRTWLEFSIFVYWIRQGHDTWSKIKNVL